MPVPWCTGLRVSAPTSSLKHRARTLGRPIAHTAHPSSHIHLIGHSTGGLDARLVLAPTIDLGLPDELRSWRSQVKNLITLNTPHYGTPLASYFATVAGTRMLYALSLLTVISLRVGEPSFALLAFSPSSCFSIFAPFEFADAAASF